MDFPVTTDCAMAPDKMLLGDESQMRAIMRAHYGQPHTCDPPCSRAERERAMTLKERLHETLHVGDPANWRCHYDTNECPLFRDNGLVGVLTKVVTEWLRELAAEPHSDSGAEWFTWLAEKVESER